MEFELEDEEQNGIRFSWNVWPNTRIEAGRLVVPIGCMYSPLKKRAFQVNYDPVTCKGQNCRAVLNPFCQVDFGTKTWQCPICYNRNSFPPNYSDISETNLPAELIGQYSTMDYLISRNTAAPPPIFAFLIDRCLPSEELQELKASLIFAINLLPPNSLISLITFGKDAHIYELESDDIDVDLRIPKIWAFSGTKDVNSKQIQSLLQLSSNSNSTSTYSRFLMSISDAELTLTSILDELQSDPVPIRSDLRPIRCTGTALSVAISLLENIAQNKGARIMLFTGGPPTVGPGMIASQYLKEPIRSHSDITKDNSNAKYSKLAIKFYDSLAKIALTNGHVIDIFTCSYDQSGFYEMQELIKKTGGLVVLADAFETPMFKQSFHKIFTSNTVDLNSNSNSNMNMGLNANIEVFASREVKICGIIGHCATLNKKSNSIGETEIGIGGTSAWKTCSLDQSSSFAIFFEVSNQNPNAVGQQAVIQIQTNYQNTNQQRLLRVTTISRKFSDVNMGNGPLIQGFDQEAAAALMSRIVVFKAEVEESVDVIRWIDRMLIRFMNKFADYKKDDPSSFQLNNRLSVYPQFAFHLRRSHFLQVSNNSPDETAFFRCMLNRENVTNSLTMIQPTLEAYSLGGPPTPVLLASTSIQPNIILVLDNFFRIILFHGETIASWRDAGYAEDPKYGNFKELLEAPKIDCQDLMKNRFPLPRYVECDQGKSQARFLLSTIDPVITHTSSYASNQSTKGEVVFTDDVSLKVFMEHLKKLSVQS